ncbi:MAG: calcium-binding protein [Arenibacterium sp.]
MLFFHTRSFEYSLSNAVLEPLGPTVINLANDLPEGNSVGILVGQFGISATGLERFALIDQLRIDIEANVVPVTAKTQFVALASGETMVQLSSSLKDVFAFNTELYSSPAELRDAGIVTLAVDPIGETSTVLSDVSNWFRADDGGERLVGNGTSNLMLGGQGEDRLILRAGNDFADGQDGNDVLNGGAGRDALDGGAGDDTIRAGRGKDNVNGQSGNDLINGGRGGDWLKGGRGDDTIKGGRGNDLINGSAGIDTLTGGLGRDRFLFSSFDGLDGEDVITDFRDGKDKIGFLDIPDLSSVTVEARGDDSLVTLGANSGLRILVQNVDAALLTTDDFFVTDRYQDLESF